MRSTTTFSARVYDAHNLGFARCELFGYLSSLICAPVFEPFGFHLRIPRNDSGSSAIIEALMQNKPACAECARRKTRCNRERPCERCSTKGVQCQSPELPEQLLPAVPSSPLGPLGRKRLVPAIITNALIYGHRHFQRQVVARALAENYTTICRLRKLYLSEMEFRNFLTLVQSWAHGDQGAFDHCSISDNMLAARTVIRSHPYEGSDALLILICRQHVFEIALNPAAEEFWGYSLAEVRRYAALYDNMLSSEAADQAKKYAPFWMRFFSPSSISTFALLALSWSYEQCTEATFECEIARRNGETARMHALFRRIGSCSCVMKIRQEPWPDVDRLRIVDEFHPERVYNQFSPCSTGISDQVLPDSVVKVILFGFQIFSPFDVTEFSRHPSSSQAYRQLELALSPSLIESFRLNVARASLRAGFQRIPRVDHPIRRMGEDKEQIMLRFLAEMGIYSSSHPAILIITAPCLDKSTKCTPWMNDSAQALWHLTVEDLWSAFDALDRPRIDPDSGMKLASVIFRLFHPRCWPILAAIWNELWFRYDGVFAAPLEIHRLWDGSTKPMLAYGCLLASPRSPNSHDSVAVALCPFSDAECRELLHLDLSS